MERKLSFLFLGTNMSKLQSGCCCPSQAAGRLQVCFVALYITVTELIESRESKGSLFWVLKAKLHQGSSHMVA